MLDDPRRLSRCHLRLQVALIDYRPLLVPHPVDLPVLLELANPQGRVARDPLLQDLFLHLRLLQQLEPLHQTHIRLAATADPSHL